MLTVMLNRRVLHRRAEHMQRAVSRRPSGEQVRGGEYFHGFPSHRDSLLLSASGGGFLSPRGTNRSKETLEYACTCSNGTEPGLKYYDSSLYSLVCQEAFKQCSEKNAGDPIELPKCEDDIQSKCGTLSTADLPDEDESDSSDDSSDGDEESNEEDSSEEDGDADESEDEDGGSAGLRPVWGTAALAAAIGAMAYVL